MRYSSLYGALVASAVAISCGGGGGGSTGTQTPVFTSVNVSPPSASIAVGGTQQLTASARDQNGNPFSGAPAATWTSADQNRATVSTSGLVTGVTAGQAVNVTASITHGGVTRTGQSAITVTAGGGGAPSLATVQATGGTAFSPTSVTIAQGGTVTWEWSGVDHNVTFTAVSGAPANIATRATGSESRTFAALGTFPYSCTLHAGMNGEVRVVAP